MSATTTYKYELVYKDLAKKIRRERMLPGDRLPTEDDLARQYGTSRDSVRRGLRELESQGIIVKRQGSGVYVADSAKDHTVDHGGGNQKTIYVLSGGAMLAGTALNAWAQPTREGLVYGAAIHGRQIVDLLPSQSTYRLAGVNLASGVIVLPSGPLAAADLVSVVPSGVPIVLANRRSDDPGIPSIWVDHKQASADAVEFLITLGHRRIALMTEDVTLPARLHIDGYQQAMAAAGLSLDPSGIARQPAPYTPTYAAWPTMLKQILSRQPRPTALLMHNEGRVLHILEILSSEGIRVPDDLSLIIFDDDMLLSTASPPIACVRQPLQQMARQAVDLLIQRTQGAWDHSDSPQIALSAELIVRKSVAPPRPGRKEELG